MNKPLKLLFVTCLFIGVSSVALAAGGLELTEPVLARINEFCIKHKFRTWNLDLTSARDFKHEGTAFEGTEIWFHKRGEFLFKYSYKTKKLTSCFHSKFYTEITMLDHKTFREFDDPPEQKWTSESAVGYGHGFARACLGEMPENLGPAKFEFYRQRGTYNKETNKVRYRIPYWQVEYPRIDKNGYEFQAEYISIKLFEEMGPYSLHVKMYSSYKQVEGEPLKQEKVMKAALAYAGEMMKRGAVVGLFRGGKINEAPASAKLEIVKPNRLADLSDLPASKDIDLNARLAWVIWFEWTNLNPKDARQKGGLAVWIDAHTGKPLGGDAF
ncbi:MAG: hypothetical protein HC904_17575 [Blastochloris sp.]|nr:hypothetical protein [Blastochloris sp.]